jgi:hypothetical protein
MEWRKWLMGMGKGKGVRPVDQRRAGPAARHIFARLLSCFRLARLSFALLQELSKEWVIEFVATASRAYQQSFIA